MPCPAPPGRHETIPPGGQREDVMHITDVKIRKIFPEGKVRAIVSIILDGEFAVHDLKVIRGIERLFVAMPNRRSEEGRYQDIVHPITAAARAQLEDAVLGKYRQAVEAAGEPEDGDGPRP